MNEERFHDWLTHAHLPGTTATQFWTVCYELRVVWPADRNGGWPWLQDYKDAIETAYQRTPGNVRMARATTTTLLRATWTTWRIWLQGD